MIFVYLNFFFCICFSIIAYLKLVLFILLRSLPWAESTLLALIDYLKITLLSRNVVPGGDPVGLHGRKYGFRIFLKSTRLANCLMLNLLPPMSSFGMVYWLLFDR